MKAQVQRHSLDLLDPSLVAVVVASHLGPEMTTTATIGAFSSFIPLGRHELSLAQLFSSLYVALVLTSSNSAVFIQFTAQYTWISNRTSIFWPYFPLLTSRYSRE